MMPLLRWEVYGNINAEGQCPKLGEILATSLKQAKEDAIELFPNAASVWMVGDVVGGSIIADKEK